MSSNVGKSDPPSIGGTVTAIEAHEGVVEPPGGPLAFSGTLVYPDSVRGIQEYLRNQLSLRSKQNALDALRRLTRMISGGRSNDPTLFPWAAITPQQARAIRGGLYEQTVAGTITPGTANLTLCHLRGLIRSMYEIDLVTPRQHEMTHSNALKNVPGKRDPRGRALTSGEEKALRVAAKGLNGYRGVMLDTAIVFAIGFGLRRDEIAKLKLGNMGARVLTIVGKGNKQRKIPIDPQISEAADSWLGERARLVLAHDWFFCSPQLPGEPLSPWSFWNLVRTTSHVAFGGGNPCGESCQCLETVTGPHDFRRTFATRLLDQGYDIGQVQALMGHESPETTARYDKRDEETLFEKRRNTRVIA